MAELTKVIKNNNVYEYEKQVNEFISNKDIVITSSKVDTVTTSNEVWHVAYFTYLTEKEFINMQALQREREIQIQQAQEHFQPQSVQSTGGKSPREKHKIEA